MPHGQASGVKNMPKASISVVLAVVSAVLPMSIVHFRLTPALRWMFTTTPTKASAALDWGNMKVILRDMGMDCDVYYKANDYADFQKQVKTSKMTIALVSSANDDKLWQRVPGHYVTLCLYNPTDDTILLGDPGSPTNNRSRVPLSYVYDALKTTSKFQYLLVDDYAETDNTWLHDGIDENWIAPENL